jgi:CRISPR/Cas system CSM-associated protein Csm2 small subunit
MFKNCYHHSLLPLSACSRTGRRSEALARQMMEKLRIAEEDDEFEKAFKNVMQVRF